MTPDILLNVLAYGMDAFDTSKESVCVFNAGGVEPKAWHRQSFLASVSANNTLECDYNTMLLRATRQNDETMGLIAMAMDHLAPDGVLLIAQENRHGAASLEKRVSAGFLELQSISKQKCRVLRVTKAQAQLDILAEWTAKAAKQQVMQDTFWSKPGLFSWDRADAGSQLLLRHIPDILPGKGADLGCGYGYLSVALTRGKGIKNLVSVDIDARAVECCQQNVQAAKPDFEHTVLWRDVTTMGDLAGLDWVVMNPPFHTQLDEMRALGQKFCDSAMKMLKSGGNLYLVANRHMPYEGVLKAQAKNVSVLADQDGFKILQAQKA